MLSVGHPTPSAISDDPYAPDAYKRAIYLPAPSKFTITFLEPTKQGHSHSYGMRISAAHRATSDRMSTSTALSLLEYDIWRRWEDCLWFQDSLEQEYSRQAREKKQRLQRGKGVKKNGFYLQDRASSFESLPPGPHPDSVAQDIHEYLPRLTKKGTVFRASQATINQRYSQIKAMVDALYHDDLPTLLQEIRASHVVTDFFGYWRRDFDLYENARKRESGSSTRSIISSYFSSSHSSSSLSRHPDDSSRTSHDVSNVLPRSHVSAPVSTPDMLRSRYYPNKHHHNTSISSFFTRPASRPRALSTTSSDSSSCGSDRGSDTCTVSNAPDIVEEVPIRFGHNPQSERLRSLLEVLTEDKEINPRPDALALMTSLAVKRRRKNSARSLSLNHSPPLTPTPSELTPVPEQDQPDEEPRPPVRESWMTVDSAATYLDGLHLSLPPESTQRTSVATFLTTDSAEAIVQRRPPSRSLPPSPSKPAVVPKSRLSQAITLSDFDMWSDGDEDECDAEIASALGTGMRETFPRPVSLCESLLDGTPDAALGYYRDTPTPICSTELILQGYFPPSPTSVSGFSLASSSSSSSYSSVVPQGMISIKVALNQDIVVLRIPKDTSFEELRDRLHDKFAGQEGLPLSKSFAIALTYPIGQFAHTSFRKSRSNPMSSAQRVQFINSQSDWDCVLASYDGGKLVLRILDTTL